MADLLSKNYNFNLRSNIVNTLVPYGASKAMGGQLADIVTDTIVEVHHIFSQIIELCAVLFEFMKFQSSIVPQYIVSMGCHNQATRSLPR